MSRTNSDEPSFFTPITVGLALVAGGMLLYHFLKPPHPDELLVQQLRNLINGAYQKAEPNLMPLVPEKTKTIQGDKISMQLNLARNLVHKDKVALLTNKPFEPPFERGLLICDLLPEHRLLYNKYYFLRNHLLVVTQRPEPQTSPLSVQDFKQVALAMSALEGSFFFNCGPQSGYSQDHKHVQLLPRESLQLPIMQKLYSTFRQGKLNQLGHVKHKGHTIYLFTGYEFLHGIVPIKPSPSLGQTARQFHEAYLLLLEQQRALLKEQDISYNLLGCRYFLALIPRRREKLLNRVGVNAVGFMGSILLKDQELYEQLEYLISPTDMLRELTYQLP